MPWLSALVTYRLRRISTEACVENMRRCALVKSISKLHRTGIVLNNNIFMNAKLNRLAHAIST